jgi:putative SOS response-associated peptidase YedK
MCGRFSLVADPNELRARFAWLNVPDQIRPRYNVAPTQPVAVVANDGTNRLDYYVWGLIPFWAKDPSIGNRMINARAETLSEKPAFKAAYRHRRCLVLADGFFEWRSDPSRKSKTPMHIRLKNGQPFAFAGLWERWSPPDGSEVLSCTIITTQPNDLMSSIHNRMPVILSEDDYPIWLDPGNEDTTQLQGLLKPYPSEEMIAYPVSTLVNNPANDLAACIQPLPA